MERKNFQTDGSEMKTIKFFGHPPKGIIQMRVLRSWIRKGESIEQKMVVYTSPHKLDSMLR